MAVLRTFQHLGKTLEIDSLEEGTPAAGALASQPGFSLTGRGEQGAVEAPGAGGIVWGPLTLSAESIAPGEELTLSAQVGGPNIAFIYLELLLGDPATSQFYGPVCREHVVAPRSRERSGVVFPDWGDPVAVQVTFRPVLRLLSDGVNAALAFLWPTDYTVAPAEAGYTLDGLYTAARTPPRRTFAGLLEDLARWAGFRKAVQTPPYRARLFFNSAGEMTKALSFRQLAGGMMPRALIPQAGDQFAPVVRCYTPTSGTGGAWQEAIGVSNTLTFGGQPLRWTAEPALPGTYQAGLVVQDLDGQFHRQYARLTIRETGAS